MLCLLQPQAFPQQAEPPGKRLEDCCMTVSLTLSTFPFSTSGSHEWGNCEFHFSLSSEDTHEHPQGLHFETGWV